MEIAKEMLFLFSSIYFSIYFFYLVKKKYIMRGLSIFGLISESLEVPIRRLIKITFLLFIPIIASFVTVNIVLALNLTSLSEACFDFLLAFVFAFIILLSCSITIDLILRVKYIFTPSNRLICIIKSNLKDTCQKSSFYYSTSTRLNILKDMASTLSVLIQLDENSNNDEYLFCTAKKITNEINRYNCKSLHPSFNCIEEFVLKNKKNFE